MNKLTWLVTRRRRQLRLAMFVVTLAILFVPGHSSGAEPIQVERDVAVPMRDGTVLRANVFRPSTGGPYPVLVWRTPYGKSANASEPLVRAGFIVVTQDARGRYASDGQYESFLRHETHDGTDGHDTVQWAAKLPNSTGKVGLFGTSYPGFLAWRAAGAQPASLGAMAAFSIPASYLDLEGPGTIRPGRRIKWWYGTISPDLRLKSAGPPPHSNAEANKLWASEGDKLLHMLPWNELPDDMFGSEAPFVKQWLKEPWQDPWHLERDAEKALVPNLNVCGWYDHCNGSIDLHLAIASRGANFHAKRHSRLIVGPWGHSGLGKQRQGEIDFGPSAAMDFNQLYAEWFGHWLRDDKNDVPRWAPIRLFVMGVNEWRNFYEWPPKYAEPREWFLDSDGSANTPSGNGRLAAERPADDASDRYEYDPRNPVPTLWTSALFTVPADQSKLKDRQDFLVYQSEPLAEYVEAIGYPEVVLHAASSCPDTDFFARLIDVAADGRAIDVTSGMVRARYRENAFPAQASPTPKLLEPDAVTEFRIRLRPTAHRFLASHRIRLDVTSSDFPNYDRNHNTAADQNADAELVTASQTVHHGPTWASRLVLPVMHTKSEVPVADQANHRIQRFSPDGTFVVKWGGHGSEVGQFGGDGPLGSRLSGPHFCAFDASGHLYTTEGANVRIQRFDPDGKPLFAWTGIGEGPGCFGGRPKDRTNPFEGPIAVTVDHQGRVWVSSTNNRVQCFSADGKFLTGIGDEGAEPGEFIIPHGLAIDSRGWLYVVDASNQRVQVFDLQ